MQFKLVDKKQEAKLNMYQVVIVRCDDNTAVVDLNVAFKNAFTDFKAIIAQIEAKLSDAGKLSKGFTANKNVSAKDLCAVASKTGGYIYAYASKIGDNVIKTAVNFSASDLLHLKDGELAPVCQRIHDLGAENKDALADYNVTTEKLAELQAAIDGYTGHVDKPRQSIIDRKVAKASIKELFKQADAILKEQMDKLVEDFADDNPDFVAEYKSARIIIDPKTGKKTNDMKPGGNNGNPPA